MPTPAASPQVNTAQPLIVPVIDEYFRRDQSGGITAPDLSKTPTTEVDHIVRARGKKTCMTSISLDQSSIAIFGPQLYKANRVKLSPTHALMEHDELVAELQRVALASTKAEKTKAVQALRYAKLRREALIKWSFNISSVQRKNLITWAYNQVQQYFDKV